jgi:hypothetical protein
MAGGKTEEKGGEGRGFLVELVRIHILSFTACCEGRRFDAHYQR